jgi:hypothetical protein
MSKANYSLRLLPSLKAAAERMASADGTSLNQFINVVAEKLSALNTEEFFRLRVAKGGRSAFLSFLDGAGDDLPESRTAARRSAV